MTLLMYDDDDDYDEDVNDVTCYYECIQFKKQSKDYYNRSIYKDKKTNKLQELEQLI